jgi:hypothetical protein
MKASFTISAAALHHVMIQRAAWLVLSSVTLLLLVAQISSWSGFTTLGFVAVASALLYIGARSFVWVSILPSGIVGPMKPNGPKVHFSWGEKLIVRSAVYAGLPCVQLVSTDGAKALILPTEITKSANFRLSVKEFAPENHVLLRLSQNAA